MPPRPSESSELGVLPFEPDPNDVRISLAAAPVPDIAQRASGFARCSFPLARSLVETHGCTWTEALALSRTCWESLQSLGHAAAAQAVNKETTGALVHEDSAEGDGDEDSTLRLVPR